MTLIPTETDRQTGITDSAPPPDDRRDWLAIGIGLVGLIALLAVCLAVAALASSGNSDSATVASAAAPTMHTPATTAADAPAPTIAEAKGVAFEPYHVVDPTLPAVPAGAVKRFTVDVDQHDVQVDAALAPTEAWTYTVNGKSLAPSQGGYAEFTLDQQGNYPFVTHAFGDMVKGAAGMLHTDGAPAIPAPQDGQPGHDHAIDH